MHDDAKLREIDDEKRKLCAEFRRKLSELLDQEAVILGLIPLGYHEIEIYY